VPYYITTPILFQSLQRPRAERSVFLVQREVAERISAMPGGKTYGALSVNLQALARAELIARVPPGAFRPPPKVDSAVVILS
jgi:16S rRNA (adenine1518-N6/adenine1519-N6)-dimethyltransferase